MPKQLQWAIGGLALLIVGFVAFQIYLHIDLKNFNENLADGPKIETETPKTPLEVIGEEKPKDVPGFEWVKHDDHYYKVKIDETEDTTSIVKSDVSVPTSRSGLTHHAELFETNPVEALRLQSEERGHPATKWIPPFPPEDLEAQEFARNIYLFIYLDDDDPAKSKAIRLYLEQDAAICEYPAGARRADLLRLTWVVTTPGLIDFPTPPYLPSDYFQPKENIYLKKGIELLNEKLKKNKLK